MEEDIELLEKIKITSYGTKEELEALSRDISQEELNQIIKNLINKYKEQEKIINLMAIGLFDYANLGVLIDCPAEYDGIIDMKFCKMNLKDRNCIVCIKEYFKKKAREK